MKAFSICFFVFLFSIYINSSKAENISDFQIGGLSLNDSLLNTFTEKEIKKAKRKTSFKNKKYSMYAFFGDYNPYDQLVIYTERKDKNTDKIDLTYWMNSLQPIPLDDPLFVTLNSTRNIDQNQIYDQVTMRHPVYDVGVLSAQKDISLNNGDNRTWFSGAWMKNGFHEDGLSSGLDVARSILAKDILPIAAE